MWIRDRRDCREIRAIDGTALRELLNPAGDPRLKLGYSLAEARLGPGAESRAHKLKSSEVYYLLQGQGRMRVDEDEREARAGQAIYIPPGSIQSIRNTGKEELVFICLVDPAWRADDEELVP